MKADKFPNDRKLLIEQSEQDSLGHESWGQQEVWIRIGTQYIHGWTFTPHINNDNSSGTLVEEVNNFKVALYLPGSNNSNQTSIFQISVSASKIPEEIEVLIPKLCNQIEKKVGIFYNEIPVSLLYSALRRYSSNIGMNVIELTHILCDDKKNYPYKAFFSSISMSDTRFFRDQAFYSDLRERVLPDIYLKNINQKKIAIWVAACATGEEVYSLAIELIKFFPPSEKWDIQIFATDLSSEAVQFAEKGTYLKNVVTSQVDSETFKQFFSVSENHASIKSDLSKLCAFSTLNLCEDWPQIGSFDIILIRNVLYYFKELRQREIMHKIKPILHENTAYVCLGLGEKMVDTDFVSIKPSSCIFHLT
jgi:chemotaxis methyl-accepting protein methylase